MKITRIDSSFPAISIDDFMPSEALARAAAESFDRVPDEDWVKYGGENAGQVQYCSKSRLKTTPEALLVMDYISTHFDPSKMFGDFNLNWKREYSAVLCISENYDESFDLLLHDGKTKHTRLPYKFNRLNVFKCSDSSWHGLPEITKGLNRKTLGVMYWSVITDEERKTARTKAKFKYDLEFK